MEIHSYNSELAIANLMFSRLFSDIKLQRVGVNNNVTKEVLVNCVFGNRSRIIKNWENTTKRGNMKLPLIVINRTGYSRNSERLNNLHNEVKYEMTSKYRSYDLYTPVPIDISYDVTIISKYPSDIDQIASNFMIFFNNDIYVTCEHPKYSGLKMNNQIILNDSISEEFPDELEATQDDLITSTFQFTFKTYLFGGAKKAEIKPKYEVQLSTYLSNDTVVSTLISTELSNEYVYEGLIPTIKTISVGWYPVPYASESIDDYLNYIEPRITDPNDLLSVADAYVDRTVWVFNHLSINT
jgi:hypothetical protein